MLKIKANSDNPVFIQISQAFLPGGGGIECSLNQLAKAIYEWGYKDIEIITTYRPHTLLEKTQEFDAKYFARVYRTSIPLIIISLTKRFEKIFATNVTDRISFLGKISMAIYGFVITLKMFFLTHKRLRSHRKRVCIIQCHSWTTLLAALISKVFLFNSKKNLHIYFTNGFVYKKTGAYFFDKIFSLLARNCDGVFCVSEISAQYLISDFNVPADKVHTYNNWLNLSDVHYSGIVEDVQHIQENKAIRLLFVGRIVPEKGIREIIALAKHITNLGLSHKYHITIIGDSDHPVKDELITAVNTYSCLTYKGYIEKPNLWKEYTSNDIFLMTSLWDEGFGNTSIEAFACGLPVIGTNKGAIPAVISCFPIYETLNNLEPTVLLEAINKVHRRLFNYGRLNFYKEANVIIKNNFSEANFEIYKNEYMKYI